MLVNNVSSSVGFNARLAHGNNEMKRLSLQMAKNPETGKAPMGSLPGSAAPVHGGGNMTLREYISFWQETYAKHQSRPTTYAAHNYVFKNHILPGLGDISLSELT